MGRGADEAVFVEAPARIHFGMLDLGGSLNRWFGGLGAGVVAPSVLVSAVPAATSTGSGPDSELAVSSAQKLLEKHHVRSGAFIRVHRSLPRHVGLGSGTQLALAAARAVAEIYDLRKDAAALAAAVGRAQRSGIGTWTFEDGGLVVESGHRPGSFHVPPMVARIKFPPSWRCLLAIPRAHGMSGDAEREALARLPRPPEADAARIAHLVLMSLLPALVEGDLNTFGAALSEIQRTNGRWFSTEQGGVFAPDSAGLVREMLEHGAAGAGQSSWGPAVYGIVDGQQSADALAACLRERGGESLAVYAAPFTSLGARVWRAPISDPDG